MVKARVNLTQRMLLRAQPEGPRVRIKAKTLEQNPKKEPRKHLHLQPRRRFITQPRIGHRLMSNIGCLT